MLGALSALLTTVWCGAGRPFFVKALMFFALLVYTQSFWTTFALTRGSDWKLPRWFGLFTSVSAPWMAWTLLLFAALGLAALLHLIPAGAVLHRRIGCIGCAAVALMILWGLRNAATPTLRRYNIGLRHLDRPLNAVVISDLHLGSLGMTAAKLKDTIDLTLSAEPDVILIAGDILDWSPAVLDDARLMEPLRRLKAPLGVVAVLGNHDQYTGAADQIAQKMRTLGMTVLVDQFLDIDNGRIRIVGRHDASFAHHRTTGRAAVAQLMQGVKADALTIVMDHSPEFFDESVAAHADLQVSGHTHNGQFFPNNLIERFIFRNPWGIIHDGDTVGFTTCGVGTWGPPVRLPGIAEVALLHLTPRQ